MSLAISVVIPAYNEAGYLESTLKSLQQQDFAGAYEVIVVDNNSTDDTAAVAVGFVAFGRVFYVTATNIAFVRAAFPG